jgi:energy-coupling factor transporter ATP-binding protein EcfA2
MATQNGKVHSKPVRWTAVPKTGAIYILGHRGQGKSALAWHLADSHRRKTGYPSAVAAYRFPPAAAKALPKWITHVSTTSALSALKKPHVVVIDESVFHINSRRSQSDKNIDFTKLLAVIRHKGHLLIFISQTSRQVDIQMIEGFDLVLMKAPSLLQVRSARAELRPEIEEAFHLFAKMRGDTRKKVYAFDPHRGGVGMLTAAMPAWWTQKVSKAYGSVVI